MNKKEILDEMRELKERLNNLEKQYNSLTPPNKRWRAEKNGYYYFITTRGELYCDTENVDPVDDLRYSIGNYFETIEEAKFEIERLKVIAELKEWATPVNDFSWEGNTGEKKYVLEVRNNHLVISSCYAFQFTNLYFASEEIANSAIEAVGVDRIIKYYFRRGERI